MSGRREKRAVLSEENLEWLEAPQTEDEETIDLLELTYALLAKWKQILAIGIVFALILGAYSMFLVKPVYDATSTIYILNRRDTDITNMNMSDVQVGTYLAEEYVKVFEIWEVHDRVIKNLNLPYTCEEMQKKVKTTNEEGLRILEITATADTPQMAADIANEYAKVVSDYVEDNMDAERPSIMSKARAAEKPANDHKIRNTAIGFIAGAALTSVIVLIKFLMDDKYKTAEDIRKYTGMVTLAVVPVNHPESIEVRKKGGRK